MPDADEKNNKFVSIYLPLQVNLFLFYNSINIYPPAKYFSIGQSFRAYNTSIEKLFWNEQLDYNAAILFIKLIQSHSFSKVLNYYFDKSDIFGFKIHHM